MTQEFSIDQAGYKYCPICASDITKKVIDGFDRLVCKNDDCSFAFWNNPTPVVAAIVEHEGKVVFARNTAWPEGFFETIAGYLEASESPEKGIIREVKEELNLTTESVELIGLYPFPRKNQLIIAYHVVAHGSIGLSEELAEWRYYSLDEIRPWPEGTGLAVKDWVKRKRAEAKN